MKEYKKPEIEIVRFETEDITNTSMIMPDIDGGSVKFEYGWLKS